MIGGYFREKKLSLYLIGRFPLDRLGIDVIDEPRMAEKIVDPNASRWIGLQHEPKETDAIVR